MRVLAVILVFAMLVAAGPAAQAQNQPTEDDAGPAEADIESSPEAAEEEPEERGLPAAFSNVSLGMGVDTVKEQLQNDPHFAYRGDPDVTLTPDRQQQLIEAEGLLFVERGFFQFQEEELYIIILQLNRGRLDYYTMYTDLTEKYGEPDVFSPSQAVWENEEVRLSLEKPLTVKYVDLPVFESLVEAGEMERSQREISREDFLELF
jgi:hypothetical protein